MATRTSPRLQSRSAKKDLLLANMSNNADRVKALKAQLARIKTQAKKEAERWKIEQARLLREHEEWVWKEDQAIAKLRAENEGLAAQLVCQAYTTFCSMLSLYTAPCARASGTGRFDPFIATSRHGRARRQPLYNTVNGHRCTGNPSEAPETFAQAEVHSYPVRRAA